MREGAEEFGSFGAQLLLRVFVLELLELAIRKCEKCVVYALGALCW